MRGAGYSMGLPGIAWERLGIALGCWVRSGGDLGIALGCWASPRRELHCWALNGAARHCTVALNGATGHSTVPLGTAQRCWAFHGGGTGHSWMPQGTARWHRAFQRAAGQRLGRSQAPHGAAKPCTALPGTRVGNARRIQAALPCPQPRAPRPQAGAGVRQRRIVLGAGSLAQQMAGITKQLAAAKPIIYLIMIYHLTT